MLWTFVLSMFVNFCESNAVAFGLLVLALKKPTTIRSTTSEGFSSEYG